MFNIKNIFKRKFEYEDCTDEAANKVYILKNGKAMELEVPDDDKEGDDNDDDN